MTDIITGNSFEQGSVNNSSDWDMEMILNISSYPILICYDRLRNIISSKGAK